MTDGMSMALAVQQFNALAAPLPSEPVTAQATFVDPSIADARKFQPQRYDAPLPPGSGVDFESVMNYASQVSEKMSTALGKVSKPADKKAEQLSPELRTVREVFTQMREFTMVELHFSLIGKSLQLAENNIRQLYQMQG
jgi:hypothetical protein